MSKTTHVNYSVRVCVREVEGDDARGCSRVVGARRTVFRRVAAALPNVSAFSTYSQLRGFSQCSHTTFSDGCLGSINDEGRSEVR